MSDIIFLQCTVFLCTFNLPEVKQKLMSSIINHVYELPHKFLNDLRLRILGNEEMKRKSQDLVETQAIVQSSH